MKKDVVFILLYHEHFKRKNSRYFAVIFFLCVIFLYTDLFAESNQRIAVLYPESGAKTNQLYNMIIKSMRQHKGVDIQIREFSTDNSVASIQQWLQQKDIKVVVLLGQKGLNLSNKLTIDIPIITGAHLGVSTNSSAVSLSADPVQLFQKLKKLKPDIKQVDVIYNNANSGWLIKKAKKAAKKNYFKLNAVQVDSVQAAGQALKKIVNDFDARTDAIWLPYDPILPIKHLLPDLLRKSWQKNLTIFSGNPYHVQQGTLFALFPDYSKLGTQLIDLALYKVNKNNDIHFETSQYLYSAINIRTASHLGIQLSDDQKNNYKIIFPKK